MSTKNWTTRCLVLFGVNDLLLASNIFRSLIKYEVARITLNWPCWTVPAASMSSVSPEERWRISPSLGWSGDRTQNEPQSHSSLRSICCPIVPHNSCKLKDLRRHIWTVTVCVQKFGDFVFYFLSYYCSARLFVEPVHDYQFWRERLDMDVWS